MSRLQRLLHSPHALPVAALALLHLALFRGVFWGARVVESGDLSAAFLPWQHYGVSALRAGYLPEWFPHSFCGYPFIANVQAHLFHPTFLLSWLWDPAVALSWSLGFHMMVAALGAYAWFYYLTRSAPAALLGALVFCPGGFFAFRASVGHTTVIYSLAPLGWACLCVERLLDGRRAGPFLGLVACLSLSLLGGHPQFTLYIALALAWIVLFRLRWRELRNSCFPHLAWIGLAGALFLLCCSAQLLPTAELIAQMGDRDPISVYQYAVKDSVGWLSLLTLLHPDAVGTSAAHWVSHSGWHEINLFMGVAALCAALALLPCMERRRRGWTLAMLLLLFILAMGNQTPVYEFLYRVFPPVRLFRGAARIQCLIQYFLALAAALGLAGLLRAGPGARRRLAISTGVLLSFWLALLALLFAFPESTRIVMARLVNRTYALHFGHGVYDMDEVVAGGGAALLEPYEALLGCLALSLPLALLACGLLLVPTCRAPAWAPRAALLALTGLVMLESGFLFARSVELPDRAAFMARYFPRTPTVEFLAAQPERARVCATDSLYAYFARRPLAAFFPNRMTVHGVPDARGYDRLVLARYTRYFNRMQANPPDQYQGMILKLPEFSRVSLPMLARLNVGFILSLEPLRHAQLSPAFAQRVGEWEVRVYRFAGNLGPAFLCAESALSASAEDSTEPAPGRIEYSEENPEDLRCRVHAERASVLVFSQVAYPGWRAFLNGVSVPVEVAYETFTAVRVPAGSHEVRLQFHSPSVRRGAALSLVGVLATLAVFLWLRRRERTMRP